MSGWRDTPTPRTARPDSSPTDRLPTDRLPTDRLPTDRLLTDRLLTDRLPAALPATAYAAALARLPGMGPARLVSLLRDEDPETVWRRVLAGEVRRPERDGAEAASGPRLPWAGAASGRDVAADWCAMADAGITVAYLGGPGFPDALAHDPQPPGVLFWLGDLGVADRPCVALVGTRQCTSYGRAVAAEIGRGLAESGVCVVSGLAIGIDGAAHQGALTAVDGAGPLGVAASGVDTPYPVRHTELWYRVAAAGAVISETAPGQPAQPWRFPARNRLIAGVAQALVVVESHAAGGSMLTVAAAAERGVEVLAVPGPVTSAASLGTNQLLHEGVAPARHAGDVLAALGDLRPWPAEPLSLRGPQRARRAASSDRREPPARRAASSDRREPPARRAACSDRCEPPAGPAGGDAGEQGPQPLWAPAGRPATRAGPAPARRSPALDPAARRVLDAVDRTPTATGAIADRTGLPIGSLSKVLLHLEALNLVRGQGLWWERCDPP